MADQVKRSILLPVVLILALIVSIYVGTYCATVERGMGKGATVRPRTPAAYRVPGRVHGFVRTTFVPINWLDRKIRPQFWEPWQPGDDATKW
jgi:hypothetical protein